MKYRAYEVVVVVNANLRIKYSEGLDASINGKKCKLGDGCDDCLFYSYNEYPKQSCKLSALDNYQSVTII